MAVGADDNEDLFDEATLEDLPLPTFTPAAASSSSSSIKPEVAAALAALKPAKPSSSSSSSSSSSTSSTLTSLSRPPSKSATPPRAPAVPSPRYAPPRGGLFTRVAWSIVVVAAAALVVVFVRARPREAREVDVVVADLGAEALPCRRLYGRGSALHCEIARVVVDRADVVERRSRLEATRVVAKARGFATVVLVDDERPWRVIDTTVPVPEPRPAPAPAVRPRRH